LAVNLNAALSGAAETNPGADQVRLRALAGRRTASMNAASAGESWRRPALAHIEIQGDRYPAHLAARAGR
jgi:hypothetical protein